MVTFVLWCFQIYNNEEHLTFFESYQRSNPWKGNYTLTGTCLRAPLVTQATTGTFDGKVNFKSVCGHDTRQNATHFKGKLLKSRYLCRWDFSDCRAWCAALDVSTLLAHEQLQPSREVNRSLPGETWSVPPFRSQKTFVCWNSLLCIS